MDIEAEENGTLYILTSDDAVTSGVYNLRLKKYDPVTKQWSTVGGNPLPLDFKTSTSTSVAISIAPDGTPLLPTEMNKIKIIQRLFIWIMKLSNGQILIN